MSRLRGDGIRGVLGILAIGPYSIVGGGIWADVPEERDVVSQLSFVIESEDPSVGTSGTSRS